MKANRRLRILLSIVLLAWVDVALAQDYIYFDLSAGNVSINATTSPKKYTGYRWKTVNGTTTRETVTGTHTTTNRYYIYQSQDAYPEATDSYKTTTGNQNGTIVVPTYAEVYCEGQPWAEYVTNNTDVDAVHANWKTLAPTTYRQEVTNYKIQITGNSTYDLTIDNLWCTTGDAYTGSIYLKEGYQNVKTTIRLKNTNKLMRVFYTRKRSQAGYLKFTSADGDGSNNGSLTLTLPDPSPSLNLHCYALIGAGKEHGGDATPDGFPYAQCAGVYFNGGTIYAGGRKSDNSIWPNSNSYYSVIGGTNSYGEMYFNGGRVTAISHSTAAAIGGGGGVVGQYGSCKIDITGGEVYAYNFGVYLQPYNMVVPGVAIGGGSTGGNGTDHYDWTKCGNAEVTISGGTVYAQSVGGAAIGGGTSATRYGGYADITISENADVTAVSVPGIIAETYEVEAGAGLGGGTAGHSAASSFRGGNADIVITGGSVNATAIGGGNCLSNAGAGGAANVTVTGGSAIVDGKIGGGRAFGSGKGGDASIYVTGGTLDCASVGGGNSKTGTPGAVSHASRAGVQIEGGTVLAGYIGGGTNNNGAIGKATAYITDGDIQGQFIMSNTSSTATNHCYFTMEDGTIDNTNVGTGKYQPFRPEGGVLYIDDNHGTVNISGGTIKNGTGTLGGAVYMTAGSFTLEGTGVIQDNTATENGGAVYLAGTGSFTMTGGTISGNTATENGGGAYVNSGTVTVSGDASIANNSASQYGGGLFMGGGTGTFTGGSISGNSVPNGCGGGVYMMGGTCSLSGGSVIGGDGSAFGNTAKYGGGIYSGGGTITVKGGKIQYNNAQTAGGGIYTNGTDGEVNVALDELSGNISYIEYNSSAEGGGIYANRGTVNFSDGQIRYNYASRAGGGIYVNDNGGADYGKLFMKGSAKLTRNHVPNGKSGGGVYLKGVITIGEYQEDPTDLGTITAKDNFAHTLTGSETVETYTCDNSTRNNVFLLNPMVDRTYHKDVITVIEDGISNFSEIGFSVLTNFVPVIYCANSGIPCIRPGYEGYTTSQYFLHQFSTGMEFENNLFNDTHQYTAVHYADQLTVFDPDHVYLYGFWTDIVNEDPTGGHYEPGDIDTPEKLAYFISYVNGINDCAGDPHPSANGNITADIDMSQYGWVPIGEISEGYKGTLNGNGHTITGISSLLNTEHMAYGIIGNLNGGTVKNLFVKDAVFALEYKDDLVIGGLVGETSGNATIENSEVSCSISAAHPNTVMGGMVGRTGKVALETSSDYIITGDIVPFNGVAANKYQKTEFVIPSTQLTSMINDNFSSIQFYLSSRVEEGWGESSFLIFMKEVGSPEVSAFSGTSGATVVYEGELSVSGTRLAVNFADPYQYHGGDLLIGIYETTTGTVEPASFYGCSSPQAAIHGESDTSLDAITSGTVINFMPKVLLRTSGQDVTIGNGTATNSTVPIRGSKVKDNFQKTEYIVPASELTSLAGGTLSQLQLFMTGTASSFGSTQKVRVYLKEVENTTVGTSFVGQTGTEVFYGKYNCTTNPITITFTTPFEYHGGNLLVAIYLPNRGGNNRSISFVGEDATGVLVHGENSSKFNNITSGTIYNFMPKTHFVAASATSHEVICDGAKTNQDIPVSGRSANLYQKNEFIIPKADLDVIAMTGAELTSLKFYLNTPAASKWGDATFQVYLKETANTTMTDFMGSDGATLVYEGGLDATGTTMKINFMNPYIYGGDNLLVCIYQTGMGTASDAVFAGIELADASIHGESALSLDAITSGVLQNMRPKTVVGYLPTSDNTGTQTIHSSIAVADMSGFLMGGLVGQNLKGNFSNSFANAKFNYKGTSQYMGGLVAENKGTMESCYVRLRGNVPDENFGWLAGLNNPSGQLNYCYVPKNSATAPDPVYYASNLGNVKGCCYYLNDTETPYTYMRRDNQVALAGDVVNNNGNTNPYIPTKANSNPNPALPENNGDQQMLLCLNNWVSANGATTYTPWSRTTTKVINNDLPILKMNIVDGHNTPIVNAVYCTGNADGTENEGFLNYGEVNDMLLKADSVAIWLYQSKSGINSNKGGHAKLYIDEGVTVIQSDSLYAYVGVTLDNSANINGAPPTFGDVNDWTDWHMFATPLSNAPLGINYKGDTNPYSAGDYTQTSHPEGMPYYQFYDNEEAASSDEDWARKGYFPSHVYGSTYADNNSGETTGGNYYREWDFYTYYEPEYHWINFKRNSFAHYHQNSPELPIAYTHYDSEDEEIVDGNEVYLTRGRGYLLATRDASFLQCHGLLNHGSVSIPVTYSGYYSPGYNFLGNPYQAYLDFDQFATINEVLWGGYSNASYAIIDEDEGGYIYHAINGSANPNTAPQFIAPHQGFMILAVPDIEDDATADFYPSMRDLNGDGGAFRGDINYPLVNLIATDNNGNRDIATVEIGRPDRGGAPLMRELRLCKGHVWCHYEGKDWAIAFTQPGLTEAAIRFETFEDGEYTMRWNTQNGEFHYLHLIDNMTGADIDCLTTDEYRFASTTMDYKSRFRLVFGYTGIEEPEGDGPSTGSGTFAYQSGDELVVTGEGTVELFDVTGRRMATQRIESVQGTMSVSGLTPGVYLLRLSTATGTRVQKIVINQ